MSLYGMFQRPGPTGFGYSSTAEEVTEGLDLTGRTYVVTGCNSGLGNEAVRVLAKRGAKVVATARTVEKAAAATTAFGADIVPIACELSEPASVRAAVEAIRAAAPKIDGIIANAGIMALPDRQVKHGLELQFLTNHIGHFLLVTGLLGELSSDARVVILSSAAHNQTYPEGIRLDDLAAEKGYTGWGAYGQSKLANLLFARELARRLPAGQTSNAVHPGVINTNLGRHMNRAVMSVFAAVGPALVLKSVPEGAATEVFVAVHPKAAGITGKYWSDCNLREPSRFAQDDALAAALWKKTEEIVAGL